MRITKRQAKATSLDHTIELAKRHAKERRLPSKVMADLMGVELKTYYRWLLENTLPLNRIAQFEALTGSRFTLKHTQLKLLGVNGQEPQDLWPLGWIVHRHQARSGFLARGGLMRSLAWPYLFKNYSVRDLAEFLEIYGLPVRLGKYPAGASDKEKTTLLNALVGIGHNAAGIIPETMMLELLDAASGSGDTFMNMVDWCERTQSKIILGGTLTTQADGKTSTNALGQIHNEVRHDLLVSDAKQLAATLTRQLIAPLLYLNTAQAGAYGLPELPTG